MLAQNRRRESWAAVVAFDPELVPGVRHRAHLLMLKVAEVIPVGLLRVSLQVAASLGHPGWHTAGEQQLHQSLSVLVSGP